MKAIETHYKGHLFRSRLEARWAVFFDALEIEWQYEVQGYEKVWGDEVIRYLPDFYLPALKVWVEVKGCMDKEQADKLGRFLDFDCPLPHFTDSRTKFLNGGLLILGDIPDDISGIHLHRLITHHKGLHAGRASFVKSHVLNRVPVSSVNMISVCLFGTTNDDFNFDGVCPAYDDELERAFSPKVISAVTPRFSVYVKAAYNAARQARFEHGQIGAPSGWSVVR